MRVGIGTCLEILPSYRVLYWLWFLNGLLFCNGTIYYASISLPVLPLDFALELHTIQVSHLWMSLVSFTNDLKCQDNFNHSKCPHFL